MNTARGLFINKDNSFTACINKKNMRSIKMKMKFSLMSLFAQCVSSVLNSTIILPRMVMNK